MSLDAFRSAVGIFTFLAKIRFDSLNFTSRHCSRTRHHTEQDWLDMKHHVAYLYTTRLLGLVYYPRLPTDPIPFTIQGASDYGDRVFADGTGILGVMICGGSGLRGRSAPIMASSIKDRGVIAFTTPDGELKSFISMTKTILDMRVLAEDLGNPQLAPLLPKQIVRRYCKQLKISPDVHLLFDTEGANSSILSLVYGLISSPFVWLLPRE